MLSQVTAGVAVAALGVCNQRETVVFWSRKTGQPLNPAIVWQDIRGVGLCARISDSAKRLRGITGLSLSPYYSAAKIAWALENLDLDRDDLCVGTMDSYLIFRLTGGRMFVTDVSNASRTQLMDLTGLVWDSEACGLFGIPENCLPRIMPSDSRFGATSGGIPILCAMGDSHAGFFGHGCFTKGMVKTTYGTGSSVMMHAGFSPVIPSNGLSASIGFGFGGQTCYVLEGNITSSGDTLCWLRDSLELVKDIAEAEALARSVADSGGVMLVPAFSGLGAPYFQEEARALLCGMTRGTTRAHVARAAVDSIAHQNADVLDAMAAETGTPASCLNADGGGTSDSLLMQLQADLTPCAVQVAKAGDLSALGAAYMAGVISGVYESPESVISVRPDGEVYTPNMPEKDRLMHRRAWKAAVARAL